jgi:hypothetical protein
MNLGEHVFETREEAPVRKNRPSIEALELAAESSRYTTSVDAEITLEERVSEQISKNKNNPQISEKPSPTVKEEITKSIDGNYIILEGRKVTSETVIVNPNETIVWTGNPRNFEVFDVDTSDLLPHIISSGGNTIPVYGRRGDINGKKVIEIIAGSRRRVCCITAEVSLLVTLLDCTDEEALSLTEDENTGRAETTFIATCRWHLSQFQSLKASNTTDGRRFSEADYAKLKGVHPVTIQDYLAIGAFPDEIIKCVTDPKSWSYRACKTLRKLKNKNNELVLNVSQNSEFTKANAFLKSIEAAFTAQEEPTHETPENVAEPIIEAKTNHFDVGPIKNAISIIKGKKTINICIDASLHPRLITQLESTIEDFAN